MILEEQGFAVTSSDNAEDAWSLFQQARFDIVVTDYRLKGMNGGDLIRLIRNSDSPAQRHSAVGLFVAFLASMKRTRERMS